MGAVIPFAWRRLGPAATVEYCVDPSGTLLLRRPDAPSVPPIEEVEILQDGQPLRVRLAELGLDWTRAQNGDGWAVRTQGSPITMWNTAARWSDVASEECAAAGVDPRLLLACIGADMGDVAPDPEGRVRTGGPFEGLVPMDPATAATARPDLFANVPPAGYGDLLTIPEHALAAAGAHIARFPDPSDPLAVRARFALGDLAPSRTSRWGASVPDERLLLYFAAHWNDDAALRAGEQIGDEPSPLALVKDETSSFKPWWLAGAVALGIASIGLALMHNAHAERAAQVADDDEFDDDEAEDEDDDDGFDEDDEEAPSSRPALLAARRM